jgi:hypothetical protein
LILEIEEYCLQRFGWSSKQLLDVIRSLEYSVFFLEYRYPSEHLCVPSEEVAAFMEHFGDCVSDHADNNPVNRHVEHGVRKKVTFGDRSWMQGSCFAATSSGE